MSRIGFDKRFIGMLGAAVFSLGVLAPSATAASEPPKPTATVVNTTAAGAAVRVALSPQTSTALLKQAQRLGPHSAGAAIGVTFGLRLRNLDQLKAFLRDVQSPGSPSYHRYLTPAQFTSVYGPTQEQVQAVVSFLKQSGIAVTDVTSNRLLVHTRGSAAAYEHALGIRINDYSLAGRSFFSTEDSPKLPAGIVGSVANVIGLNNAAQMRPHSHFQAMAAASAAIAPHAAPTAAPGTVTFVPPVSTNYYNPTQIEKAYGWPDITDTGNGGGVTTDIITAESSGLASDPDFANFWSILGLPSHQVNIIPVDGDDGLTAGMGETLLDIEWSGVMSPGETLNVYVAADPSFTSFTDAFNRFVTDNSAQVMSTSWGAPEADSPVQTDDQIFMEAAAQGISMFAAAGDHGASDGTSDSNMADFPAVDLYVTAANGTELQIADVSGTYASEAAWSGTGGAISQILSEPDWQTGPGVPANGWRNDSDLAMNAGGDFPYIFVYQGTWFFVFGTSAVAPQLAAMFADGVSASGGVRLGQSNSLIYNDVNTGNYASDFRDVTNGSNGIYSAGTEWDHPTGWGSPIVSSLLSHITIAAPAGTLAGTVTASGGQPVPGAKLVASPGNYSALTRSDGSYSLPMPAGSYSLTVSAFGYTAGTGSASVSAGSTTTQDFVLNAAPTAAVTGNVTDGGGHSYGLYAQIIVTASAGNGPVADIWTNPQTGAYHLDLPQGYDYQMVVTPALVGYVGANATLMALSGDLTQDFSLGTDGSCTTPGYAAPFGENFDGAYFPPGGWTVTNNVPGSTVAWNTNDFWYDGNFSGGSGVAATADSSSAGQKGYTGPYDTTLVTPPIAVASLPASPVLQFDLSYQEFGGEALDVDVSGNGGATWTTLAHITADQGTLYASGVLYQLPITLPPGATTIQLRWRYYNLTGGFDWYAQIDNVSIGQCGPVAGGLVVGSMTETGTGTGLAGAAVVDDVGDSATAFQNPTDTGLPAGYYFLFAQAGSRTLTATDTDHSSATAALGVADGSVSTQDFSLGAARFAGSPGSLSVHAMVNSQTQQSLQVSNTGSGAGSYQLLSFDSSVAPLLQAAPAPLLRVPCPGASPFGLGGRGLPPGGCSAPAGTATRAAGGQWTSMPPLPVATIDAAAADDSVTGKLYVVGGVDTSGVATAHAFLYDPSQTAWRAIASMPIPLDDPVAAWVNGKLYVTAGWTDAGNSSAQLAIYDPGTGTWSMGAADPAPEGGGAAAAVLDGKLYVIGGCPSVSSCGDTPVEAYDPGSDSWSAAGALAAYPHTVSWQGCGGVGGKIYCAGGTAGSQFLTEYPDGYAYDPTANAWTAIAPLPVQPGFSGPGGLWASASTATEEGLLLSGGINHGDVTNQGWMYSPASNSWTALPNSSDAVYRGAGACGFFRLGGTDGSSFLDTVELLPGYNDCGISAIPWLSMTPASAMLVVGASGQVNLSFDGTGQQPYTSTQVYLLLGGDTPYADQVIPLTVNWDPQPVDLAVSASAKPSTTVQGGKPVYQVSYSVTVSDLKVAGHGPATQATLSYTLPTGVAYVGASGPAACSLSGQALTCSIGSLALGASATEVVTVAPGAAGALAGSFSASAREPDSSGGNTATVETTVLGVADVGIKSDSVNPTSVTVGGGAKFNLSIANAGPDAAGGVAVSIALPAGLSFESATASMGSCTASGSSVDCNIGALPAKGIASVWISVQAETAGTASVSATLSSSSVDTDAGNDRSSASLTVNAAAPSGGSGGGGGGGGTLSIGVLGLLAALGMGRRRRRLV